MKNKRPYLAAFIAVVLLVTAAVTVKSISKLSRDHGLSAATFAEPSVEDPYTAAVQKMLDSGSYSVEISSARETQLPNQILRETSTRTINCRNLGQDDMQVDVQEQAQSGPHSFRISERYTGRKAYVTLDDSHFSADISGENFLERFPSAALITPQLYGTIEAQQQGALTLIGFSDANEIEPWAAGDKAVLSDASGSALIDSDGNLIKASYSVVYELEDVKITRVIAAQYGAVHTDVFTPIVLPGPYVELPSIDVPRLLEKSTGYLLQAEKIHADKEEKIHCQAGNLTRTQHTLLDISGLGDYLDAKLDSSVELIDFNQGGTTTDYRQIETFREGQYSLLVTEGTAPPREDTQIASDVMEKYCHDFLVGSIVLPQFIESISMEKDRDKYTIVFRGSDILAEAICADACMVLYQDPNMLSSISTSYHADRMETTLLLDANTLLPIGSGFSYKGTHMINDTSYTLTSDLNQTYSFQ